MSSNKSAEKAASPPEKAATPPSLSTSSPSSYQIIRERILIPVVVAGWVGAGYGLLSKHRKVLGALTSAVYATNCAVVAACYCSARELIRVGRGGKDYDLLNSAVGGFATGASLGGLQGGKPSAVRYSVIFAVVGPTVDYATLKLKPVLSDFYESMAAKEFKVPEWSPIRLVDEEEQAKKRAREQEIYDRIHNLNKLNKGKS